MCVLQVGMINMRTQDTNETQARQIQMKTMTQNIVQAGESLGGRVSEAGRQLCAGWTKQFSDF